MAEFSLRPKYLTMYRQPFICSLVFSSKLLLFILLFPFVMMSTSCTSGSFRHGWDWMKIQALYRCQVAQYNLDGHYRGNKCCWSTILKF